MEYEFTITLKPTLYRMSAKEQFRLTAPLVKQIIQGYKISIIAELTSANNIHYHAMVYLDNHKHRDQLINRVRSHHKTLGKISCSQLVDQPKWIEYLRKNKDVTNTIIEDWPWVRDDYEISGKLDFKVSRSGNIYIDGYND